MKLSPTPKPPISAPTPIPLFLITNSPPTTACRRFVEYPLLLACPTPTTKYPFDGWAETVSAAADKRRNNAKNRITPFIYRGQEASYRATRVTYHVSCHE